MFNQHSAAGSGWLMKVAHKTSALRLRGGADEGGEQPPGAVQARQ